MFPELNDKASKYVQKYNMQLRSGKYILPVGSAMLIDIESSYIVAAPTMFRPMSIKHTNNVYYAFNAALKVIKKNKNLTNIY